MTDQTTGREWRPDRDVTQHEGPRPNWPYPAFFAALARGMRNRCPACGQAALFAGWLQVRDSCPVCTAPLGAVRADDAPPYFVIFITGHLEVPVLLAMERAYAPPMWVYAATFMPLTVLMVLLLLRPVKGATVGLMLRLGLFKDPTIPDPEDDGPGGARA